MNRHIYMKTLVYGPESQNRSLIARELRARSHDVTVRTVPEAKTPGNAAETDRYDACVLVDAGDALLQWGRRYTEYRPETQLVVVGVENTPEAIHRAFEAGASDVILKGFETSRIGSRLALLNQYAATPIDTAPDRPKARQQAVVAEIGRRALAGTELGVLMAQSVRAVSATLGVEACKVLRHNPQEGTLTMKAGTGWAEGTIGGKCVNDGSDSQAGYTLTLEKPVVVQDVAAETRFAPPELLETHDVVSGVSVAIASSPEPYGVLGAHSASKRAFSEDDVYFLQSVANVLAGAVDRSRTEQALRESEARATSILETTVDGIITIDDDGMIRSFNAAAEEIFGYVESEVIGKNVKLLMPAPYREEHDGYMRSYHETGRRRIIGIGREVTGRRKDGSTFPMDLAVSEVHSGSLHAFTGIVRDISERRRLEKEILDISEQERRRIGQDLHDGLGQMLTGIGLLSQNLTRQLKNDESQHVDEAKEITDLIKEADQYARDLARGLTPVDLEASGLSKALRRLSDNAERLFGVDCTFDEVGTGLVHNATAATHMYRIAQEAVSNAVRHGSAGRIKIAFASGSEQIRLRIQDDGVGFAPDHIDGPGMGVHIMNYRARIIGGTLEISSEPSSGTTVTCTLPGGAAPDTNGGSDEDDTGPGGPGLEPSGDGAHSGGGGAVHGHSAEVNGRSGDATGTSGSPHASQGGHNDGQGTNPHAKTATASVTHSHADASPANRTRRSGGCPVHR